MCACAVLVRTRKSCPLTTVGELHLCFGENTVVLRETGVHANVHNADAVSPFTFHTTCFPKNLGVVLKQLHLMQGQVEQFKPFCARRALHASRERSVRFSNSASQVLFRFWHSFQICIDSYSHSMPLSSDRRIVWSTALSRERAPPLCQLLHHLLQGGPAKRREKPIRAP